MRSQPEFGRVPLPAPTALSPLSTMSSSRFVRASNYRHVYSDPPRAENCFSALQLATATGDHNYIKGSAKFFSLSARGGGGPLYVIPYNATGKLPTSYPTIAVGAGNTLDTDWNPFNDNMVAVACDNAVVKLFVIPSEFDDGLKERITEPAQTLSGHAKPVTLLRWHPTAANVLASASKDLTIKIWDVEAGVDKISLSGFDGLVQDMDWNYNGSQIAVSSKDKQLRIFDARSGEVLQSCQPHEGMKCFKLVWLGDTGKLITCGFTKQSKRVIKFWNSTDLSAPFHTLELDQGSGVMMPFYDEDSKVLFIAGKGDGNIRYFEIVDEAPYCYALSEYRTSVSQKGVAILPKRACSPLKCEITRLLKLTNSSTVEPLSFIVPRKSEAFHDDLYPDARSGEASLNATEWFDGANADPKRMSMDPAKNGGKTSAASSFTAATPPPKRTVGGAGAGSAPTEFEGKDAATLFAELVAARKRIAELEAEVAALKGE